MFHIVATTYKSTRFGSWVMASEIVPVQLAPVRVLKITSVAGSYHFLELSGTEELGELDSWTDSLTKLIGDLPSRTRKPNSTKKEIESLSLFTYIAEMPVSGSQITPLRFHKVRFWVLIQEQSSHGDEQDRPKHNSMSASTSVPVWASTGTCLNILRVLEQSKSIVACKS